MTAPWAGSGTGALQPNAASTGTAKNDHRGQAFIISAFLLGNILLEHYSNSAPATALSAFPWALLFAREMLSESVEMSALEQSAHLDNPRGE
ncbi:MAG: hypothetical protein ABI488_15475 [Polyangiaceae bacterium]